MQPRGLYIFIIGVSIFVAAISAILTGAYVGLQSSQPLPRPQSTPLTVILGASSIPPTPTHRFSPAPPPAITSIVDNKIPFTSQAPLGQWSDPIFQDGCEEASILMAMHWVNAVPITSSEAATEAIRGISQHQIDTYGEYRDRSAADTAQLLREYFKYDGVSLKQNVTIQDIKDELALGNIITAPINGRALPNHHYTPPGPERHMLIIRGYDPHTKEFITNDPGTKFGEAFRFNENDLFTAIRDYPTGYHEPIQSVDKNMIVVHPAS